MTIPDHIYIFGAGRWARVYCSVLIKLPVPLRSITVISPNHAYAMSQWAEAQDIPIRIVNELPVGDVGSKAAIVANRAASHAATGKLLLRHNIPTLIEKPMATSVADIKELMDAAQETGTYLAVSHVFLFAAYIDRFKRLLKAVPDIATINFEWEDPVQESRYGETKSFDDSILVTQDVFPHIYSILNYLLPDAEIQLENTENKGGSEATLKLTLGTIPCSVHMKRNGVRRKRIITVTSGSDNFILDFSAEPGTISCGGKLYNACPTWNLHASPLSKQITKFFSELSQAKAGARLTPAIDLASARIIYGVG